MTFDRCTYTLRENMQPYPRTCQECGLGPCKRALATSGVEIPSKDVLPKPCAYKRDNEAECSRCGKGPCRYERNIPTAVTEIVNHASTKPVEATLVFDSSSGTLNVNALVIMYGVVKNSSNIANLRRFAELSMLFSVGIDKACDALAPVTQWQEVKDGNWPDPDKDVLVYSKHFDIGIGHWSDDTKYGPEWACHYARFGQFSHDNPTHWCNLIAPPL